MDTEVIHMLYHIGCGGPLVPQEQFNGGIQFNCRHCRIDVDPEEIGLVLPGARQERALEPKRESDPELVVV